MSEVFNPAQRFFDDAVARATDEAVALASTRAVSQVPAQSLTRRTGDGTAENPYRTRHVFILGVDALGDPDTYWMDVPPEVLS